jgi:DNA-binding GntR family transcriptional regulator
MITHGVDIQSETTQSGKAYAHIRHLILQLALLPGSQINERQLMEELSFGRTPTREALLRLAAERLVLLGPGQGIKVCPIGFEEVRDIYEVRLQEDRLAARLCLLNGSEADHAAICSAFSTAPGLIAAGESEAVFNLDFNFHRLIFMAAKNDFLASRHHMLLGHYYRLARLAFNTQRDSRSAAGLRRLVQSHDGIIAALKLQSVEKLDAAVVAHTLGSYRNIIAILSESRVNKVAEMRLIATMEDA